MNSLIVFYDGECGLCSKVRRHLTKLAQRVPLVFLPYQDPLVQKNFPALATLDPDRRIIALSDAGEIYAGDSAWIAILWTLRDYRSLAFRLACPRWRRFAKKAVHFIASHRQQISTRLGLKPQENRKENGDWL